VTSQPDRELGKRRLGACLALLALALQIGFGTAHSAWHFDHLVGAFGGSDHRVVASGKESGQPLPGAPGNPDLDRCAVRLGLLAGGSAVIAGPLPLPIPTCVAAVGLHAAAIALAIAALPHFRPPPRGLPVIGISA
jgi:hypothetical protein